MKTRIVLMSLIFVVAPMLAGCGPESGTENRVGPENRAASTTDKQANAKLGDELKQAAGLLKEAQSELEQKAPGSNLKALRTLGYPVFVNDDFANTPEFVKTLTKQKPGQLSAYLVEKFSTHTKSLLQEKKEKPDEELVAALTAELNEQLRNKDLYDQSRFPEERLTTPTLGEVRRNNFVIKKLPAETVAYINRLLLQDSYRTIIVAAPAEGLLRHMGAAQEVLKNSPDLQAEFGLRVEKLILEAKQLPRKTYEPEEDFILSSSAVSQLGTDVEAVLKDLDPSHETTATSETSFIDLGWLGPILYQVLKYVLVFCAAAMLIGGVIYAVKAMRHRSALREQTIQRGFDDAANRHDKLHQDFTSFKNEQANEIDRLKQQIVNLENEQRKLSKQLARSATEPNHNTFPVDRYYDRPAAPAPVKEEPEFPVAAETYLRRLNGVNRQSTVIRPDFQNGILVKDADGRGELLLIEDPHTPFDYQRLLVVPSVSEFQMRQDFYNYYDTYYECDQPGAGPIWILNPAIVEKVNGGWRLTEKGRLEVRG